MSFKRNVLLTATGATLALSNFKVKAQESTEAPLDTLTRYVQSMSDDISKMKRLKITGYVQPQYQYIDSAGAPSFAGGDFTNGTNKYYSRFTMRRGRFKFTYTYENVEMVINTDATEKGLNMRETFIRITDPWKNMFSLTAGLLQDQFGFEVTQSSSERETPERARYNQTLFPTERDLGVFGTMQMPQSSPLYGLKVDVAIMNGSAGVSPEFDSHKGVDAQISFDSKLGGTTVRAEYIQGEQPGSDKSSKSPSGAPTTALFHRNFNGAYFYFVQTIGRSKFQVVAKYDWYDPNVKISGTEIGKTGTNTKIADIRFDTYGFGITYNMNTNLKFVAYYDLVNNEKTLVSGYRSDIKDNVLTIRMQFKY
ncbi:MAG: hypothetical protein K8R85_11795 [Bacteroidetes bacterium]|nr:hypothetical protein [Bacteroidota bacterium]